METEICRGAYYYQQVSWLETGDGVVLVDVGWSDEELQAVLDFAGQRGKVIDKVIVTHSHVDHIGNLPRLRKMVEEKEIPAFLLVAHKNSTLQPDMRIEEMYQLQLEDTTLRIFPTPGHSEEKDDISIYDTQKHLLFTGDLCQPQGPRYSKCTGLSPIPLFHHPSLYIRNLTFLSLMSFKHLHTGHGDTFDEELGKNALLTTLQTVLRIKDLAQERIENEKGGDLEEDAKQIYLRIAEERGYLQESEERLRKRIPKELSKYLKDVKTYYDAFDKPGIVACLQEAKVAKEVADRRRDETVINQHPKKSFWPVKLP